MLIYTFPSLQGATVLKRPSAKIRSPYVADIELDDGTIALCHTPGLGCSGLVVPGSRIYVSENADRETKTDWTVQISEPKTDMFIGVHPLTTQNAIYSLLNKIHSGAEWASEIKVHNCRLDYVGYLPNGKKVYVEVKTVMTSKEKGVAVFPDRIDKGKKSISPRAVAHANVLSYLAEKEDTDSCHLIYAVSRSDCTKMVICPDDIEYKSALHKATIKGVKLHAFVLEFDIEGEIVFKGEIPVENPLIE